MDPTLAPLVGAFGGSAIGLIGAYWINERQVKAAEKAERRRTLPDWQLYL